ncbi:MAG: hypothetical protein EOT04_00985 [Candidatus Chaera renei]|uniref:Cell division protein FtsL n=1 Tax=Candidatus Chaera renei TaxID=2506947 RepID=A0A4Q0AJJ7_9BACT|nr:MAG: hypothetical protein EOT04_00985 [Candidatus Chaera renei]
MKTGLKRAYANVRAQVNIENATLALALLIALSLVWSTMQALQRNFLLQQKVDRLVQETQLLGLENDTLKYQQNYLKSAEYLELSARDKLSRGLPGEKLILLPQPPPPPASAQAKRPSSPARGNFEQWLYFFFGRRPGA